MKTLFGLFLSVALLFALDANAAAPTKIKPIVCAPVESTLAYLTDLGLIAEDAHTDATKLKVRLLDDQILGKTTGQGTEKYYPKGHAIHQYTHLLTYPAKQGGAPVKVIMISECMPDANTMDAVPLLFMISPAYVTLNWHDKDDPVSMLNNWNIRSAALQAKQDKLNENPNAN
jgi:hypothetical protein